MTRPIRSVLPIPNIRVTLPAGATKAYSLYRRQPLPISKDSQRRAQVTLPLLEEYEVIVFER